MLYPLKLAYYKGLQKSAKKRVVTTVIRLLTGVYSHVELVFPSELYEKNCFSSSGYDKGVRYKKINFSHPERWGFQTLGEYSKKELEKIRSCCDEYIGKEYATLDVIRRFGFGKPVNDPDKFWCSEACLRIINDAKLLKQKISENLAPTRMYIRVERMLKK
jgi:hypothetical protein